MLWILSVILIIVLIASISKGSKKKNLEIEKLENEVTLQQKAKQVNSSSSKIDALMKLKELKDAGVLTDREFEDQKAQILKLNNHE